MTTESLAKTLRFLKSFDTKPSDVSEYQPKNLMVSKLDGQDTWIVENYGVAWWVVYNGGEIMVGEINSTKLDRSVPTRWFGEPLNEATIACRIAMVLRGEEINYEERLDADCQEALETARY